ncbi:glycosyltransferase, MGT family [Streptoalloteichus tenebrarius]|uniref:Glycosyltransferase, MGT family n=1 Tax=Streptoalloteichus tenebrarius (strain ATCC 17920 / DSM 40477 / JCM 4838 / CBS 697.72 / NBRC 16177 / NCIMB 11028 / NRRL B-12390 / A12253. 1 / ISP 5477) TaxID=1933 RepID=A0ABT1HMV1_STRSD|nr:macrolide family glycosyltransferase [Streptoalloteichus tenebrarius]MCP2256834.1 glycosyltransferase, MGT family [Streptoalloteichus tenebrarius]BFF00259.1 glycosyltransferase [Streptoalloteichus tenebrarius]
MSHINGTSHISGTAPAHVLVSTVPAHGHVNPMLGIVSELVARGHRVSYTVTEEFAPRVAAAGATPVVYRSILPSGPQAEWPENLQEGQLLILRDAENALPQFEAAFRDDRPDIVLSEDPTVAARLLAERWGVPAIHMWEYLAMNEHWSMHEEMDPIDEPAFGQYMSRISALLSSLDIQRTPQEHFGHVLNGGIVLVPRAFQYRGETFSEEFAFVGPCLGDRGFQGEWHAPEDGRPVVLVSLGSAYNERPEFYRTCFEVFGDLPWHAVLSVGHRMDPALLGPAPANVEVHAHVPQLAVLSEASLFVTHAGMGSTMEALYHGVPMVAIPQMAEQRVNAKRVEQLGVGRVLRPEDVTVASLREAVLTVAANGPVRERAWALRQETRAAGGASAAVDVIEARLASARCGR